MFKVGITGGIGSGKSTVCKIFELLGIPVYYADDAAKKLMTSDKNLKRQIINIFGTEAYFKNGRLNRKYISERAFPNPSLLKKLNEAVHPAVIADGIKWMKQQKSEHHLYALKEAALLIESGSYKDLDKVIVVVCPEDIRIARAQKRDGTSAAKIKERIKAQLSDDERLKYADFVVNNDGEVSLIEQIMKIHKNLYR